MMTTRLNLPARFMGQPSIKGPSSVSWRQYHQEFMYDHVKQQMSIVIELCFVAKGPSFLSLGNNPHQARISPVARPLGILQLS